MKAILNIRNLILGVLASLVFGVAAIAPAPVLADNHYIKPGKSRSGNYLAGRHAQARRDLRGDVAARPRRSSSRAR